MATPAQNISNALAAYAQTVKGGGSGIEARETDGDQFADLVKSAIKEAVKIGEESERLSIEGIRDRADLNQVITAVAEAELTLQTVISIRDKVVDAYKEIIRMPI